MKVQPSLFGDQLTRFFFFTTNEHGNWDLWFNRIRIGFWPSGNYRDGFPDANKAKWGGEIMNLRTGTGRRHTSTQMGSGHFSGEGRGRAAYIKNMGIFNEDDELYYDPDEMDTLVTNPMCYDLSMLEDSHNGHYMTLGGPGYNQRCP
ncbi:hypothetical protein EJ110_NYTH21244 [Nymphaea thermarum]|nr:hypothetical protein EJ110_NYTH21244 [Nymphaea thermarum]